MQHEATKDEGYESISQFVEFTLRRALIAPERRIADAETRGDEEKVVPVVQGRLSHVTMYEDHVKILDNNIGEQGQIVTVYFHKRGIWCDYCDAHDCIHVQYAWEIPVMQRILAEHGLQPPPSRI